MAKRKTLIQFPESGELIKYYRELRGLTRDSLAELAGISTHYLGYVEKGHQMASTRVLYDLAKALRVSIEDILVKNDVLFDNKLQEEMLRYVSRMNPKEVLILNGIVKGILPIFYIEEARAGNTVSD